MPSTIRDSLPLQERYEASASSQEVGSAFTMPLNDDDDDNFERDAKGAKKQCRRRIRRKYPKERHDDDALADEILAMIVEDQHED